MFPENIIYLDYTNDASMKEMTGTILIAQLEKVRGCIHLTRSSADKVYYFKRLSKEHNFLEVYLYCLDCMKTEFNLSL